MEPQFLSIDCHLLGKKKKVDEEKRKGAEEGFMSRSTESSQSERQLDSSRTIENQAEHTRTHTQHKGCSSLTYLSLPSEN